ncbi:MAG: MBG domain-containing protein, partial [Minisyncoccia bacterium]
MSSVTTLFNGGRTFFVTLAVVALVSSAMPTGFAFAAEDGDGTMAVSPTSVVSSTSGTVLTFTFTNNDNDDFAASSAVELTIPAAWTPPQISNSVNAGYVTVAEIGDSNNACNPGTPTISGSGPWTITIGQTCGESSDNDSFIITYGAGTSVGKVTTPSAPGNYTFTARSRDGSSGTTNIGTSPVVAVTTTHIVTATAGAGGAISPLGAQVISHNATPTFTSTPNATFILAGISVDGGASLGRLNSYTFPAVTADHTIAVTFDGGWSAPSAVSTVSGSVSNPTNAYTSNNAYATFDSDTDVHDFRNFNFSIPANATINGIEVAIEGKRDSGGTPRTFSTNLSWNNGTSQATAKTGTDLSTTETTVVLGGASDKWGSHTWIPADFANGAFSVRIDPISATGDLDIDQIQVKVHYTIPAQNQTINVTTTAPASAEYGASFPVAATASSGLPVAITVEGVCTISSGTVTMTSGTGSCTVKYDQAGNASWNPATQISSITNATTKAITVIADDASKVFGENDPALAYQITSGSLVGADALTGAITRDGGESIAVYAITQGTLAADVNNYALTFVAGSFTIAAPLACDIDTVANLIENPCFEVPNGTTPALWLTSVNADTASFTYPVLGTEGAGSRAAKTEVTTHVPGGDAKWYFEPVAVSPNTDYAYTEKYKSDIQTRIAIAEFNGTTWTFPEGLNGIPVSTDDWGNTGVEFRTKPDTTQVSVYHLLEGVGYLTIDQASLIMVPPLAVEDMVPNNSVETPSPANPEVPRGWSEAGYETSGSDIDALFEYVEGDGHNSDRSVRVTVSGFGPGEDADAKWMYLPQPVAVDDDQDYRFTAYYKTNTAPRVVAQFTMEGGATKFLGLPNPIPQTDPLDGGWSKYETVFSAPSGATDVTIFFFLRSDGYVQTDDYHIESEYSYTGFNKGLVTLTFDDGYEGNVGNVLPVLEGYDLPSTQCFMTAFLVANDPNVLAFKNGTNENEICAHTVNHPDLTTVNAAQLATELADSKTTLEGITAESVTSFATPYGAYNAAVLTAVQNAGFSLHRTVDEGYNSADTLNPMRLRVQNMKPGTTMAEFQSWVNKAKEDKVWLILVYHRVMTDADIVLSPIDPFDTHKADFDAQMAWLNEQDDAGLVLVKTLGGAYAFTQDSTAPEITLAYSPMTQTNGSVTVTATANESVTFTNDGGAEHIFTENGSFDFVAVDEAGNTATMTATVENIDIVAPEITLNGLAEVNVAFGAGYTDEGATATDAVDGAITVVVSGDTINASTIVGTYHINYDATDAAGNQAVQQVRTVNVTKADANCSISGSSNTYDAASHSATGSCTGIGAEVLTGLDLGASFTNAPGGTAHWTFTNEHYADESGDVQIEILPLELVGSFTADNKVYDGATDATVLTLSLDNIIALDDVTLSGGTASFDDANVGTGKTVTLTAATLSGASAGNYALAAGAITTTADITKKDITTVEAIGIDKTYDGTTDAEATLSSADVVGGDSVTFAYSATFDTENVGEDKVVTVALSDISGESAGNYSLLATDASTVADITPRVVEVTADAEQKEFGAVDPELTYQITNGSLVGDDAFTGSLVREAGEAIGAYAITEGTLLLDANYALTVVPGTFTIGTAPVGEDGIGISNTEQIYDGTAKKVNVATLPADLAVIVTYNGSPEEPIEAGSYAVVATIDDVNYTGSANGTLVIAKAELTVTAENQSIAFGATPGEFTFTLDGYVNGEDETVLDSSISCSVDGAHSAIGTYPIVCSGGEDNNYELNFVNGSLTVSNDPNNAAPTAEAAALTVNEDSTNNSIPLVAGDENGAELMWIISDPEHGTVSGTGSETAYTPDANYYGPDSFTFKVNDGNSDSETMTVAITVNLLAVCPEGFTQNGENCEPNTVSVEACEVGFSYDSESNQCLPDPVSPSCPEDGSTPDVANGECDYPATMPICPEGFIISPFENNQCVNLIDPLTTSTETPTCPDGSDLNMTTIPNQCQQPSIPACPAGFEYNGETCVSDGTGVQAPACPEGMVGTVTDGQCVLESGSLMCPASGYHVEGLICVADVLFTVNASAGANGSVSPSGDTEVAEHGSLSYTIAADANFHVNDVLVDGASIGAVASHTFSDVTANHTISATFAANETGCGSCGGGSSSSSGGGGGGGGSSTPAPKVATTTAPIPQVLGEATGGPACFQFTKNLRRGMKGADVLELQKILIAKGYLKVSANG